MRVASAYSYLYQSIYDRADSRTRYIMDDFWRGIPIVGSALRAGDNTRYLDDYLHNRGMTYDDIKYHSVNLGAGVPVGQTLNFVSRNIDKLYSTRPTKPPEYMYR